MAAKLKEVESKAASSEDIAKMTAKLAIETMKTAREYEPYGRGSSSSSSRGSYDSSSSESSWDDVEDSADQLQKRIEDA
jgi:hypothetical protein